MLLLSVPVRYSSHEVVDQGFQGSKFTEQNTPF